MLAQATRNLAPVSTMVTRSTLEVAPALDFRRALNASRAAKQLELVSAPPRWNFAGFCEYCFDRGCMDLTCLARYMESAWMVCQQCWGRGYEPAGRCDFCNLGVLECADGLWGQRFFKPVSDVQGVQLVSAPPRLNFAGFCDYCGVLACGKARCVARHAKLAWAVCEVCGGWGCDESSMQRCICVWGVAEVPASTPGAVRP